MPPHNRRKFRQKYWDGDVQDLECLGNGVSGIVFAIDSTRVAKIHLGTPRSVEDFETERAVYQRFGERQSKFHCRYILRCLDLDNPSGLVFERCHETIRNRIKERGVEAGMVLRWAKQASKGLAWVHDCKVIQGDVGCHNMLLDSSNTVKLADFAGSSIDDSDVSINYEVRSRLPNVSKPNKKSDIFALGSAMYEMATGYRPYEKLSYNTIQNLYRKGEFPKDVDDIDGLGKLIRKCWEQRFDSAWDLVRDIGEADSQDRRCPRLQQMPEVFLDSAISLSEPVEIFKMEETSAETRRHAPATYVHQTSQRRHRRSEKVLEKVPEAQGKKRHSQGHLSSWLNKSIHSFTKPSRRTNERKYYDY